MTPKLLEEGDQLFEIYWCITESLILISNMACGYGAVQSLEAMLLMCGL